MPRDSTSSFGSRHNNFGALRLVFAALVIVSHSPELVDGNRTRELLTRVFGTLSFGELAVDGFFLISGYLIAKSAAQSRTVLEYFAKRIVRIVPGYLVCFLICFFLIAPFVGASRSVLSFDSIKLGLKNIVEMNPPDVAGVFTGSPYPALNGSMWTIAYECRCYLAAAIFGICGLYSPSNLRFILLVLSLFLIFLVHYFGSLANIHFPAEGIVGNPAENSRFLAVFSVGALYYSFRDVIKFTTPIAICSGVILVPLMFSHRWAEAAFMIFGGYILFWLAFKVNMPNISAIDGGTDISYGLYLYAWPIQKLIVWNCPTVNPWLLCGLTLIMASLAAYVSWIFVEKPCLSLIKRPVRDAALGELSARQPA